MFSFNKKLSSVQRTGKYDQYAGTQTTTKTQSIETECVQLSDLVGKDIKATNIKKLILKSVTTEIKNTR